MNTNENIAEEIVDDTPEQIQVRKEKRARLLAEGRQAYAAELPLDSTIVDVREGYVVADVDADGNVIEPPAGTARVLVPGEETEDMVGIAGRVMFMRPSGKIAFVVLQDGAGTRIQVIFSLANVGKEALDALKADVDLGDFIFVNGHVGTSKRGELSVFAHVWEMASKAIRPLPKTLLLLTARKWRSVKNRVCVRGIWI